MSTDATATMTEPEAPSPAPPQSWPTLNLYERRVLGVLVEKAKTTPDVYPLSLNSLVTGCNQKNNRNPVLNLNDVQVDEAIDGLKKKGFVLQITGSGRVDKYKHMLYESLKVDKVPLAILGELLLRGPQTEGELRGRASRMEPINDLDELRAQLRTLSQRGLVVYLSPEGRRGTTLTHGFHPPDELERLRMHGEPEAPPASAPIASSASPDLEQRVAALETALGELREELQKLQAVVQTRTV